MSGKQFVSRWSSGDYFRSVEAVLTSIRTSRAYSGAVDLRGLIVGLDGQIPEVDLLDFQNVRLQGVDLSSAQFSCSFTQAEAIECRFEGATFDTCRMKAARFRTSSFRSATLLAPVLDDAVFDTCCLSMSVFRGRGGKAYGGRRVEFLGCDFRGARFLGVELRACRFIGCSFEGTRFQRCVLAGTKFEGARPVDDQFEECERGVGG